MTVYYYYFQICSINISFYDISICITFYRLFYILVKIRHLTHNVDLLEFQLAQHVDLKVTVYPIKICPIQHHQGHKDIKIIPNKGICETKHKVIAELLSTWIFRRLNIVVQYIIIVVIFNVVFVPFSSVLFITQFSYVV